MKTLRTECGACKSRFAQPLPEASVQTVCPVCGTDIQLEVFPALLKEAASGKTGEAVLVEGESNCFYHPANKAVVPCDGCGRFLCSLCDIDWGGRHLCPACIESGMNKKKMNESKSDTWYYDNIAVTVAIVPVLFIYPTLITAPIALYLSIRYWNTPLSVEPRSKIRYVIAIMIAGFQVIGWGFGATVLILSLFK